MSDKLLKISQAAEYVGVHPDTLRRWVDHGLLKVVRTAGGHRRFNLSDLERHRLTESISETRINLKEIDDLIRTIRDVLQAFTSDIKDASSDVIEMYQNGMITRHDFTSAND